MKNFEKYPNTRDAMDAYAAHRKREGLPLEEWLDREYVEPHEPTLLEAAEAVVDSYIGALARTDMKDDVDRLLSAINREKHKPVRNCDMYATKERKTQKKGKHNGKRIQNH